MKCIFQWGSQSASGDKNKQTTIADAAAASEWVLGLEGTEATKGERRLHNKSLILFLFVPITNLQLYEWNWMLLPAG